VDKFVYVCDEEINDMLVVQVGKDEYLTVLACNGSSIQVISDKGKLLCESQLGSAVNTLSLFKDAQATDHVYVAYGLQNGIFGVVEVTKEDVIVIWEVSPDELGRDKSAAVSFVLFASLQKLPHLIVVRNDSTLEVHRAEDIRI
jgi:hypothetical protein